jgi:hypothetical protein
MKRLLMVVSLGLIFCLPSFAQQDDDTPATKEDIQRYLDVMHSHEMMQQMADVMGKQVNEMVHQQFLKDKDKLPPDFEDQMHKMTDDLFRDIPWDEMMQAMIPSYQKHLTRGDVKNLVAFYSTPTGQKLIRDMPAMMADAMQSMMPIMQDYMEKVQQRVRVETARLMKEPVKKSN